MLGFDFEEKRIKQEIDRLGAKRVLLQMPQGLKPQATIIAEIIEKCGAVAIISADPCYGACDIAINEAQDLGADLIVHFGHSKMIETEKTSTLYIEAYSSVEIGSAILQAIPLLRPYKKIGLVTSIQHLGTINQAKKLLTESGNTILIGKSEKMYYSGQVIGCNYSNANIISDQVDAFVFIGGGMFHALGVALATSKPTIVVDPYDNRAYSITEVAHKLLKQRFAIIQEAKKAKTFGILVGLKIGQKNLNKAFKVKAEAEKHGKSAFILAGREIAPEMLLEFPNIEAYVNTACPRISIDAPGKFEKPVLTVNEFMVVCGESSWETLLKKGLFEN